MLEEKKPSSRLYDLLLYGGELEVMTVRVTVL
jgi:hypothetical protein